jgi:chemotaxis protein CheX
MYNDVIDISVIDKFLESFNFVFKHLFSIELKRGSMSFFGEPFEESQVAIITGVIGEKHEGVVAYSMSEMTARTLIEKVDIKGEMSSYGEMLFDVLGEWMNILGGTVTRNFNENGINFYLTPPSIVLGNDYSMQIIRQVPLLVEMESNVGIIGIYFAVKNTINKSLVINI